jgi:hypothetical protein
MDAHNGLDNPAQEYSHPGHAKAIKAVDAYHNELSTYIKKDLSDRDHLITIDVAPWFEIENLPITSPSNTNIDVIGFNLYNRRPDKLIVSKFVGKKSRDDKDASENLTWWDASETSIYRSIRVLTSKPGYYKPIILSEVGHPIGNGWELKCQGKTGNIIDVMTFGFSGIAGMHPWDGYKYGMPNEYDSRQLWQSTIYADIHMNSDKVIPTLDNWSGQWQQGRQIQKVYNQHEKRLKELQYYLSQDRTLATGYVRNRSYNVWTAKSDTTCINLESEDGFESPLNSYYYFENDYGTRNLYTTGLLSNTWYRIYWYDFLVGSLNSIQLQKSDNKGRIKLLYPSLPPEYNPIQPIRWFNIERVENAKMLLEDESNPANKDLINDLEITLRPNPFSEKLIINAPFSGTLTINTSHGVLVKTMIFNSGENILSLDYLTKGIYFIHFSDGTIKKVIKL